MKINNQHFRSIWIHPDDPDRVQIIDQRWLPHELIIEDLSELEDFEAAIRDMHVRGAPLIGATAALGFAFAVRKNPERREEALKKLAATRPTAVDLFNALDRMEKAADPLAAALDLIEESAEQCRMIGVHGVNLIENLAGAKNGETINVLTHCNAGWLACVDYGTATSPIYQAHDKGIDVHVWVDETRPRNQGARLTAYELGSHGVPHTVITDNAGGHLMQHGMVDLVLVGSDRTTRTGDVANKIGTYLKALAAFDNDIPFYVTLPGTSFDFSLRDGLKEIPIEERNSKEVTHVQGRLGERTEQVLITPLHSPAANYAFDVTPSRLVTGLITERGVCAAEESAILDLYPEYK